MFSRGSFNGSALYVVRADGSGLREIVSAEAGISSPACTADLSYCRGMNSDRIGMTAILSEKGQVTIPKRVRDSLGLGPGQVLAFAERNGKLVITKVVENDPFAAVRGTVVLPDGMSVDEYMDDIRGPADP
jgi:antitoxin PrlF